ncbi:hypothetical protein D3C81_1363460 [compost metagenome]
MDSGNAHGDITFSAFKCRRHTEVPALGFLGVIFEKLQCLRLILQRIHGRIGHCGQYLEPRRAFADGSAYRSVKNSQCNIIHRQFFRGRLIAVVRCTERKPSRQLHQLHELVIAFFFLTGFRIFKQSHKIGVHISILYNTLASFRHAFIKAGNTSAHDGSIQFVLVDGQLCSGKPRKRTGLRQLSNKPVRFFN